MLSIDEIYQKVGRGLTDPYRAIISGENYIIKSIYNPDGHLCLFNDYVGNCLTYLAGFNTPLYGFCIYTNSTKNTTDSSFEEDELFFYSKNINNPMYINDNTILQLIDKEIWIKLLIFDYFILNEDRNMENIFIAFDNENQITKLYPIDYTHSFPNGAVWDMGEMGKKIKNDDFNDFESYILKNFIHQSIIENINISIDIIEKVSNELYESLKCINIDEIIDSIDAKILSKITTQDIIDFKNFIKIRIDKYETLVEDIKKFFRKGD